MRFHDIDPAAGAPASHPYVAVIEIDPVDYHQFTRLIEDAPELRLLRRIDDQADLWTLHVACASERVREGIEDGWN